MRLSMLAISIVVLPGFAAAPTATWNNSTANTPDTAYAWTNTANWVDGTVGGDGYDVTVAPANTVYIRMPDTPVTLCKLRDTSSKAILLGDVAFCSIAPHSGEEARVNYYSGAHIYGDVTLAASESMAAYLVFNLCGRLKNASSSWFLIPSNDTTFRFDRFARAAGETRTDDFDDTRNFGIGNGRIFFYAPVGAAAQTGTWRLTKDSPYATRVSATAHPLAVGTTVAGGDALPQEAFLKHVFSDAAIELSAPALESGEVTLSFAAFTPKFRARLAGEFRAQGSSGDFILYKTRAQDEACISFAHFNTTYSQSALVFGADSYGSYLPGTLAFDKITGTSKSITLKNACLAFGDGLSVPASVPFVMPGKSTVTEMAVATGTATVNVLSNFCGTVVKKGAGTLALCLGENTAEGTLTLEEGTLTLAACGAGAPKVKSLTVKSGATLVLSAAGLDVATAPQVEEGATVTGGKVRYVSGEAGLIQFTVPEDNVPGHPAFWLDASKPESIVCTEEEGVNYVTRWNDWRDGEPMFCTNIFYRPVYKNGTAMKEKYVNIRMHHDTSITSYDDTEQLVWSVPIKDIRAVFLVEDPVDGGGEILGRSKRLGNTYYGSQGGPYYRSGNSPYNKSLLSYVYGTPCVTNGECFINAQRIDPCHQGFPATGIQILDHHVNTNYYANAANKVRELVCDAFGGGYAEGYSYIGESANGAMRISEYIIYTNTLTRAERLQVEQHLSRKWLGCDITYSIVDTNYYTASTYQTNVTVSVPNGQEAVIASVGDGILEKTGEGLLYVEDFAAAGLNVYEGSVRLFSLGRNESIPAGAWLHVDASDTQTLVTDGAGTLTQWNDVRNTGASLRSYPNRTKKPQVAYDAFNGKPVVDLGASQTGAALVYYGTNGTLSANWDATIQNMEEPLLKTVLMTYDSSAGGGPLFAGVGNGYPSKGFPHVHSKGTASPILDDDQFSKTASHGIPNLTNACANGTAVCRRNGVQINPGTAPYLQDKERFTFRYDYGRKANTFGAYGQGTYCYGGLKYGEIVCYDHTICDRDLDRAEAYLAKKWFNIENATYRTATAGDVMIAAGATLTVEGYPLAAATVTGGGTLTGDLTVTAGLKANVTASGAVETLTVSGAADLSQGGTVTFTGDTAALLPDTYTLLTADALTLGGTWSVTPPGAHYRFFLRHDATSVYLVVAPRGTTILVR